MSEDKLTESFEQTWRENFKGEFEDTSGFEKVNICYLHDFFEAGFNARNAEIEQLKAEVERLKSEQQGEMFYALKDEYFEGQYFELGCVIDDFESDYGVGDILEVLCAEITTVKHPNKFITTLGHGKTQLFGTSEEAKQAIKAAQENDHE